MPKAIKISRLVIATALTLFSVLAAAQQEKEDIRLPEPKRFIDKVEIFAGPSLSFNYGNKFINNYKDDNVRNKRLMKVGYLFGIGVYHPIRNWLDINLKLSYEERGTKSQMDLPDIQRNSEYTYKYLTISSAPTMYFDKENKFSLSLGGYYSKIQNAKGHIIILDTKNNITYVENFFGREVNELSADGSIKSGTYAPGLQAYEKHDFGITFEIGYLGRLTSKSSIMIRLADNFGLLNINRPVIVVYNPPEKNHNMTLTIGYILKR